MKRFLLNGMAIAGLALVTACSKTETTSQTEKGSDSKKIEVEYSYNQKNDLVAKMKSELSNLNDEIKKLGDKIASSTEKGTEEAKAKLERLKEKSKNLDVQINKTENATEATWEEVKAGSAKALEDVKAGFAEARDWVSNKFSTK